MIILLSLAAGVAAIGYWFFNYKYPWAKSDIKWFQKVIEYNRKLAKHKKEKIFPIDMFERTVDTFKAKPMLVFNGDTYSYEDIERKANKIANLALSLGITKGDCVAILMYNEPAFVWTWLGLQKIGVETALLNFNQRKKVLQHSITASEAKAIFINRGSALYDAVLDIAQDIEGIMLYTLEDSGALVPQKFESLSDKFTFAAEDRPSRDHRSHMDFQSTISLIFTSGTTGLPKPAIVTHQKLFTGMHITSFLSSPSTSKDIMYICLPLYHAAGSLMGIGTCLYTGCTTVLTEKFSASRFFKDCCQHKVTIIQYVGELCRFLVNSPKSEYDTKHCIRAAVGNGLRKDVWEDFQNRFKIQEIEEFYGATELPFGTVNLEGVVGSVGKFTPFMSKVMPANFVKFDTEIEEPFRDENGRCVSAKAGEPGLLIMRLIKDKAPFDGYKNREDASKRKLMHDVFTKGDVFINSGDCFIYDADKNLYFYDRLGDTFRWKGENVSTTEVSNIISELPCVHDAFVYGVTVPGCEGKAGMAAINLLDTDSKPSIQDVLDTITKQCLNQLAIYAIPRFIRFKTFLDITSTFKPMKGTLKKEGFDPTVVIDPLYYFDAKQHKYCILNQDIFEQIETKKINF